MNIHHENSDVCKALKFQSILTMIIIKKRFLNMNIFIMRKINPEKRAAFERSAPEVLPKKNRFLSENHNAKMIKEGACN